MLPTEKEKLNLILSEIVKLGLTTLESNQRILEALERCDICNLNEIKKISKKDRANSIDKVDNLIIKVFALYTPEARDLRELIAFLKITNEFDRIANSCNSFIRDFSYNLTQKIDKDFILEYAVPLQRSSVNALSGALKLIELEDKNEVEECYQLVQSEEAINDDLYKIIEKSLLKKIKKDMSLSNEYQNIMEALRRLEKIADRALSIANLMHYAKLGGTMRS